MIRRMRQAVFDWTGIGSPRPEAALGGDDAAGAASGATGAGGAADVTEPAETAPRERSVVGEATLMGGESAAPMRRELVIERILELNPTASEAFLGRFADERLVNYLDHLTGSRRPRGRDARWVRRAESRAAVEHVREG